MLPALSPACAGAGCGERAHGRPAARDQTDAVVGGAVAEDVGGRDGAAGRRGDLVSAVADEVVIEGLGAPRGFLGAGDSRSGSRPPAQEVRRFRPAPRQRSRKHHQKLAAGDDCVRLTSCSSAL
jgi:hypothetical protein